MIEWIDGFDHYGSKANMLNGAYAAVNGGSLSQANPRTGPYHYRLGVANDGGLRRVFPSGDTTMPGCGYAFYLSEMPTDSSSVDMVSFRNINNSTHCSVRLTTDGRLQLCRGTVNSPQAILQTSDDICVFAQAYQHFECRAVIDNEIGGIEIRINGVTVMNVFDLDTLNDNANPYVSQLHIGSGTIAILGYPNFVDIDDLTAVTSTPSAIEDFLGDKKVYRRLPNLDTAQADFVPNIGTDGYPMINNVPPDDNVKFLQADGAPALSIFGLEALPDEVVSVSCQMNVFRAIKTDAGNAKMQTGFVNGSNSAVGADHSITQAFTYYGDVFETDPATDTAWTVEGANAAQISIERTE